MFKPVQKCLNQSKNVQKYPKSAGFAFRSLLTAEIVGYTFQDPTAGL